MGQKRVKATYISWGSLMWEKLIIGLILCASLCATAYMGNRYIQLKTDYKIQQKTINNMKHHAQEIDKELINVEGIQYENFTRQHKALLDMDKKGFITTSDGANPNWLRPTYSNNNYKKNTTESN